MSLIHIARNNTVLGQFTEAEVKTGLADGTYLPTDLAWRAGKKNWEPLGAWPEFTTQPPPLRGEQMMEQPPADADEHRLAMPSWERQDCASPLTRLINTTKEVTMQTADTFAAMPTGGGFGRPLTYYLIPQILTGLLVGITVATVFALGGEKLVAEHPEMQAFAKLSPALLGLTYFLAYAVLMPIGIFIWAAIQHALLHLWGAAAGGYETTFRTLAYVQGAFALICLPLSVLSVVPVIGQLVGLLALIVQVYAIVVLIQAFMKTHGASGGRVTGAVLSPLILCCCCFGLGMFAVITSAAAKMGR